MVVLLLQEDGWAFVPPTTSFPGLSRRRQGLLRRAKKPFESGEENNLPTTTTTTEPERIEMKPPPLHGLVLLGLDFPPWTVPILIIAGFQLNKSVKKRYKKFQVRQGKLVEAWGKTIASASLKAGRTRYYKSLYGDFRRKMRWQRKEQMHIWGIRCLMRQPVTWERLRAVRDYLDAIKEDSEGEFLVKCAVKAIPIDNERVKLSFYAKQMGYDTASDVLNDMISNPATDRILIRIGEQAYTDALVMKAKNKAKKDKVDNPEVEFGPYLEAIPQAAKELGVTDDRASVLLDDLIKKHKPAPPKKEPPPPPPAEEEDKKKLPEQTMVKAECQECGYSLFVAKGREKKFFGDDFVCPDCGAPKEKFTVTDMEEKAHKDILTMDISTTDDTAKDDDKKHDSEKKPSKDDLLEVKPIVIEDKAVEKTAVPTSDDKKKDDGPKSDPD